VHRRAVRSSQALDLNLTRAIGVSNYARADLLKLNAPLPSVQRAADSMQRAARSRALRCCLRE
jgi:hypothetical protein